MRTRKRASQNAARISSSSTSHKIYCPSSDKNAPCLICQLTTEVESSPDNFASLQPKLLSNDISAYFLLKHILGITSDELAEYLSNYPVPGDWVNVCLRCSQNYINDCNKIFGELLNVQRNFKVARNRVIVAIKESLENESPPVGLNICNEIRRLVVQRHTEQLAHEENFTVGDLLASEKLLLPQATCSKKLLVTSALFKHEPCPPEWDIDIKVEPPLIQGHSEAGELSGLNIFTGPGDIRGSDNENKGDDPHDDDWNVNDHSDDEEFIPKLPPARKSRKKRVTFTRSSTKKEIAEDNTTSTSIEKQPGGDFECDECQKSFANLKNLQKHKSGSHSNIVHTCLEPGCDYKSNRLETFRCHTKRFHGNAEDILKLTCPICKNIYSKTAHLNRHIANYHKAEGNFKVKQPLVQEASEQSALDNTTEPGDIPASDNENEGDDPHDDDWNMAEHSDDEELSPQKRKSENKRVTSTRSSIKTEMAEENVIPSTTVSASIEKQPGGDFQCDECPKSFPNLKSLQKHKNGSHTDAEHACLEPGCGYKSSRLETLRCHQKRFHGTAEDILKLTCPICKKVYSKTSHLNFHIAHRHNADGNFKCDICNRMFAEEISLRSHQAQTHNMKEYQRYLCATEGCGKGFYMKSNLLKHNITHESASYQCNLCDKKLKSTKSLAKHLNTHQESGSMFQCDKCPKQFEIRKSLLAHCQKKHNPNVVKVKVESIPGVLSVLGEDHSGPFRCEHAGCCKIYATYKSYRHHRLKHNPEPPPIHTCEHCGKEFKQRNNWRLHVQRIHLGIKKVITEEQREKTRRRQRLYYHRSDGRHKCNQCDMIFPNPSMLQRHSKLKHPTEFPFNCELCGKGLLYPSWLREHRAEMHHICSVEDCQGKHENREELWTHQKEAHGKEVDVFSCGECTKLFIRPRKLREHQQLHEHQKRLKAAGEEGGSAVIMGDWICDLCGKGFILKKYLTYHTWHTHKKMRKPKNKVTDDGHDEGLVDVDDLDGVKSDNWYGNMSKDLSI